MNEHMKLILGGDWKDHPFGDLKISEVRKIIDKINERLKDTDYFYLICGDGLAVSNRESAVKFCKATYNKPMGEYSI